MKNISVLYPRDIFILEHFFKLESSGKVSFTDSVRDSYLEGLTRLSKDADIVVFNPNTAGKDSSHWLSWILEKLPNINGLVTFTTGIL